MRQDGGISLHSTAPPLKGFEGGVAEIGREEGVVLCGGWIHAQLGKIIHISLLTAAQVPTFHF